MLSFLVADGGAAVPVIDSRARVVHVGDGEPGGAAVGGVRFVFSRMVNEHVADAGGALTSPAAPACR